MGRKRSYAVWGGAALLAVTALFHASGYPQLPAPSPAVAPPNLFTASLRPLWLFASLHWLLTAAVCVLAIGAHPRVARAILLVCAATVMANAVLLYAFIGPFIGEAILAVAAVLIGAGAYRLPMTGEVERG